MKVENTTSTTATNENNEVFESAAGEPVATDAAEITADEPSAELGGRDGSAASRESASGTWTLSDLDKKELEDQVSKYRLQAQVGNKTIAEPRSATDAGSTVTIEAGEAQSIEDSGTELDAALARGRKLVSVAGRKALGREEGGMTVGEGVETVGMATEGWHVGDAAYGFFHGGEEYRPTVGFGVGLVGVAAAEVSSFTSLGSAHQEAHEFNHKEGYTEGYSVGYAGALYGESADERKHVVHLADNEKLQTFDSAFNEGLRRGHADASRLSGEDRAAARMYVETKMAENGEEYCYGDANVAGAYVKQAGAWYSELVP